MDMFKAAVECVACEPDRDRASAFNLSGEKTQRLDNLEREMRPNATFVSSRDPDRAGHCLTTKEAWW